MNKVTLIGRVGKDPELKTFDNGGKIVNFTVATTERWKDKSGEKKEHTDWHNIQVSGESLCNVVMQYVEKGDRIALGGSISYREYEKDGVKRIATTIKCSEVHLLGASNTASQQSSDTSSVNTDDDLPF